MLGFRLGMLQGSDSVRGRGSAVQGLKHSCTAVYLIKASDR